MDPSLGRPCKSVYKFQAGVQSAGECVDSAKLSEADAVAFAAEASARQEALGQAVDALARATEAFDRTAAESTSSSDAHAAARAALIAAHAAEVNARVSTLQAQRNAAAEGALAR